MARIMKLIDLIKTRRSIRKWKIDPISSEIIKDLVAAGKSAPSSHGSNPVELIVVDDIQLTEQLLSDRLQLKKPPHYINSRKWAKKGGLENYEKVSPPPLLVVVCGDQNKCEDLSSLLIDMSVSTENILLTAHGLGLGGCWLYVYDESMPETEENVKNYLNIPKNIRVLSLIALGYPNEKPTPDNKDVKSFHQNKW